jgi:hypothetical protein
VVQYPFDQLYAWKEALEPLLDGKDVYWLDIDESQNRLVLGVRSMSVRPRILAVADAAGIPPEEVSVVQDEKPVPRTGADTLNGYLNPIAGGAAINR